MHLALAARELLELPALLPVHWLLLNKLTPIALLLHIWLLETALTVPLHLAALLELLLALLLKLTRLLLT